ncbi:transmembrane protein 260 [Megalops cyprinoides]|uniref:transmembrane protein 260 n=1 Tax=Megalops cyprinoides TaxID=118141 RepID=UPI001864F5BF|nr:transmembrane protein 260 [Megalops cyprinoides]
MISSDRSTWVLTGATAACVAALYLPCVQRAVPGGDSGELITAACELGVAHPPGYPLFTLLSRLALVLLPLGSPAHSVNLMSGLMGAAASGALCFSVCRVGGVGPGAALAGGVFAVSRLVWQWSMVAEVFSLNNLFVGLLFSLCACFHHADSTPQRRKFAQWGALCCGLGLCNQHTLVLYIVVIVPWVLLRLHSHQELSLRGLTQLGLCFLGGFLPYLYLPVSSYWNTARWSWGDQTSLHGLLTHLLRAEYGTFSLAKTDSPASLAAMLQAHLEHCMADLPLPVLILAGVALVLSPLNSRRRCVLPWLLASMLLLYSLFFAWRANLDIKKPLLLGVVERFWLQSDAVLCVLAGLGLSVLVEGLERRLGQGGLWRAGGWALTAGLVAHLAHSNYRECDQSRNDVVERFAQGLLDSIPQNSIILTRGDLPGNTLRYLHYCQGLRPDVSLVDQEMMTYSWYVAKLGHHHHKVYFPGRWWDPVQWEEKRTFSLEQFLLHNSQRAVFACIGLPNGDPSWQRSFAYWPWGICDQLVPAQARFHPEEWARRTRNMYNWTEPHDSFHPGTWERVANEEMWQARMKTAFFLFDLADKVEGETKTRLFELSYTLYKEIVEKHKDHPSNWDKNMALASERLLRSGARGHNPDNLLTQSIEHFTLYLEKEPTDPQADAIRTAVSHLLKERQRLRERHSS